MANDFERWNQLKALDHMPVPPKYLVAAELKWYEGKLDRCGFCNWAFHRQKEGESAANWVIWVTGAGAESRATGIPDEFDVYVQASNRRVGHKSHWSACFDHGYTAYLDYQQIMIDELHDWSKTDQWMQKRMGRI